jgi:hypothetical protein
MSTVTVLSENNDGHGFGKIHYIQNGAPAP